MAWVMCTLHFYWDGKYTLFRGMIIPQYKHTNREVFGVTALVVPGDVEAYLQRPQWQPEH